MLLTDGVLFSVTGTCEVDCQNGGRSAADRTSQSCVCPSGFHGPYCQYGEVFCEFVLSVLNQSVGESVNQSTLLYHYFTRILCKKISA